MLNYRSLISKHRGAVMGLMAIVIVLYHAHWKSPLGVYNATIGRHGSTAVDVFVFLSGFGVAFSLQKGGGFGAYYARRLGRVLPSYYAQLICCIAIGAVCALLGMRVHASRFIASRLFPLGVWVNFHSPKWYVAGSLGYYVIAAMLYPALRRSRYLYLTAGFFLLVTGLYVPAISRMTNVLWAIDRLPALVAGLAVGAAAQRREPRYRDTRLGLAGLALLFVCGLLLFVMDRRLQGTPLRAIAGKEHTCLRRSLMAPLISVLIACGLELADRLRLGFIGRGLARLGRVSLELYLVHSSIMGLVARLPVPKAVAVLATVVLSCPAAFALKWLADRLLRGWRWLLARFLLTADGGPGR